MSVLSQFTNKQNLNLLWDVLLDELHINTSNTKLIRNIRSVFESNIKPFTARINHKSNIMDLNKQFLSQVVLAVNRLFPNFTNSNELNQKQEQHIKRITITDEEVLEPYKIEDIHASRQSEFEKDVEKKRLELENFMSPQKPKELDFSDRNSDSKIKAMDSLIAEKMAQRNFELETLQKNNFTASIDPDKWLTPKETSVKNEKNTPIIASQQKNNSKLKHISFDNDNNITLSVSENEQIPTNFIKKVTWNDLETQKEPINIFSKLKKQTSLEPFQDNEKQYVEQKSMPLPQVNQEIIRNETSISISSNEPVIPKTELVKQLNEMNQKIDNLYELVFNLINEIKINEIKINEIKINEIQTNKPITTDT
jgi:hypothetical protein